MKYTPKLALRREIQIRKALNFLAEKLLPYSCGFRSYDHTALGFSVMTFLHGGIKMCLKIRLKRSFCLIFRDKSKYKEVTAAVGLQTFR